MSNQSSSKPVNPADYEAVDPTSARAVNAADYEPYTPPTIGGEFKKGVLSCVDATQQGLYGLVSMAGRAAGVKPVEDWAREGVVRNEAEQKENAPAVGKLEDIYGVGHAALWAAGGLGQLVPFAATRAAKGARRGTVVPS